MLQAFQHTYLKIIKQILCSGRFPLSNSTLSLWLFLYMYVNTVFDVVACDQQDSCRIEINCNYLDQTVILQLTLCLLFATIDDYSNDLNQDQTPSNWIQAVKLSDKRSYQFDENWMMFLNEADNIFRRWIFFGAG